MDEVDQHTRHHTQPPGPKWRGIPTTFNGRMYRSLLEAKWASFFDMVGWNFEYEPFETGRWIPDFLIQEHVAVLVEVKPVSVMGDMPKRWASKMIAGARSIDWEGELLLVGAAPAEDGNVDVMGWLHGSEPYDAYWSRAMLGRWRGSESEDKNPDNRIGFCHELGWFRDRITGCYDGGSYGSDILDDGFVRHLWNRAASRVSWNPRSIRPGDR